MTKLLKVKDAWTKRRKGDRQTDTEAEQSGGRERERGEGGRKCNGKKWRENERRCTVRRKQARQRKQKPNDLYQLITSIPYTREGAQRGATTASFLFFLPLDFPFNFYA